MQRVVASTTIKVKPKDGTNGKDAQPPYVGENGNWWVWDSSQNKYVDSGDTAKGDDGRSPVISGGTWHVWQNGGWVDTGILAEGKDAISLVMSPSNVTFKTNQNGMAIARTINCQIKATRGSSTLTISASQISISGYVPYGMTVTKATNGVAIKVTSNFQPIPEGIDIYVTIDGLSYLLVFMWDSVKDGEDGYTPIKGTDYFDGKDGQDGESKYLWIRYSQNSNGNPFITDPTNAKYIGIATTLTDSPPSNYLSYDWSLIKGTDGIAGEKGSDGQTSYLHIKYSNDGTTFTANNGETVGAYIGTYVDFVEADSMVFSRYTWNKVKGEDGKDGASVEFGFSLSNTNSAPAKPTGALPNASWTYAMPLMTTYYRYLWITKRTKAQGSSTWSAWDTPVLHAYLPKDGEPGVGTPGLPGQIPITKEWIEGDTHRNTDEYVDYIYVRGTTAELSYFYKLIAKGTKIAGAKPTGGSTPIGYEPISWMEELAVKVFIAEEANIAGLIHKSEKLFSQSGETYAGIPLAIDEYIEYNFANTTSQPTVSSTSWTDLPLGTIRWVRYKKNTESTWTVKQVGISENQWQLQFAIAPENETWYSSYSTNRFWMRYKTSSDDDYGKAVKITTAGGVDFIPNILIDGVTGRMEMLSAKIRGAIEAISGRIGGFNLENMGLLSDNKLFYIDALNGAIYLMNESGDVKTSIIPYDLPSTPEAFFAGSGGGNLSLTALQGSYNNGQTKTTGSFTVDVSGGKQFSLLIPEIKGSVNTDYTALAGEIFGSSSTTIYFELMRDNKVHLVLAQPKALSSGGLMSESFTIQQRTIQISSSGVYSFRARVETNAFPSNHPASGGASVSIISSSAEFIAVLNRSQIGNNGMIIASSTTRYDYMVGDKHIIRRGNYGFRITESGLQKSTNMNASTPTWQNI